MSTINSKRINEIKEQIARMEPTPINLQEALVAILELVIEIQEYEFDNPDYKWYGDS